MSTTLTPEMISDILSRLPVKSLLRSRSTSKPFCSIIDGPDFTKQHLNQTLSKQRQRQSLILTSHHLFSIDLISLDRAVEIEHHPLKTAHEVTEVVGSCNGLLCLCNPLTDNLDLWNKSTGKHHKLPHSRVNTWNLLYVSHGFGYDPLHDDYKVMRIIQRRSGHSDTEVLIYSLRSNSWRSLGAFPHPLPPHRSFGVFGNGAIHWLVQLPQGGATVAFDLATELYRVVPQPPLAPTYFIQMTTWETRLCAVCSSVGKPTELWVQKKRDWCRLLSVSDPLVTAPNLLRALPMAYVSDGNELVLLQQDDDKFLSYDLTTKKVRDVVIRGMPDSVDGH